MSVDQTGKAPIPGIDLAVGGFLMLFGGAVFLLFSGPLSIIGLIIGIIAALYCLYGVVEGIEFGKKTEHDLNKLKEKQKDSSMLDPEELEPMKNYMPGAGGLLEVISLNGINQLECL